MSIEFTTRKALRGGWECKSHVPLDAERTLRINTYRQDNGVLVTRATALKLEVRGGVTMETWAMFGDFSSTISKSQPRRVTPAVAEEQHKAALANIEAVKAEALAFYAAKAAEAA